MLTFEQIKELIDLVNERELECLEIERSGFRLRIDGRGAAAAPPPPPPPAPAPVAPATAPSPTVAAEGPPPAPVAAGAEAAAPAESDTRHILRSPIVGTFYAAPSPDAENYVQVGDRVKKGQVLCIVEAMKLMNEIESDADGQLAEIFPKNAQPVEFGEPLFAITTG